MLGLENVINVNSFQEFTGYIVAIAVVAGLILMFKFIRPLQRVRAFTESRRLYKRSSKSPLLRFLEAGKINDAKKTKQDKKAAKNMPKKDQPLGRTQQENDVVEEEVAEVEEAVSATSEAAHILVDELQTEQQLFDTELNKIGRNCAVYLNKTAEQKTPEDIANIDASVHEMFHSVTSKQKEWEHELNTVKLGIKTLRHTVGLVKRDFTMYKRHGNSVKRSATAHIKAQKERITSLKAANADTSKAEHNLQETIRVKAEWHSISVPKVGCLTTFCTKHTTRLIHNLKLHKPTSSYKTLNDGKAKETLTQPVQVLQSQIEANKKIFEHREQYPVVIEKIKEIEEYMEQSSEKLAELRKLIGYVDVPFEPNKQYDKILAMEEYQTHHQLEADKAKNDSVERDMKKIEELVQNLGKYFASEAAHPAA